MFLYAWISLVLSSFLALSAGYAVPGGFSFVFGATLVLNIVTAMAFAEIVGFQPAQAGQDAEFYRAFTWVVSIVNTTVFAALAGLVGIQTDSTALLVLALVIEGVVLVLLYKAPRPWLSSTDEGNVGGA